MNPVITTFKNALLFLLPLGLLHCGSPTAGEKGDLFRKVPSTESKVTFTNVVQERFENFFEFFPYVYNGGGVAIGDINNDGLPDLYFTGNEVPNKLYLNQGNLQFRDITRSAGVDGGEGWHNGVSMVDINADGYLDIYVCRGGWMDNEQDRTNLLFVNQGNLTFTEEAEKYGLNDNGYSMQAAFFDMDNDNDLDVYVMNRPDSFNLPLETMIERQFTMPEKNRDKLFLNEGGAYKEIGREAGITENYGYGLSVITADFNKDNYIDILVTNDFATRDYLYINQGDGTFRDQVKVAMNHISLFSMGADVADLNNDGWEDIVVMEMRPDNYQRSKISMPSMNTEAFWAGVEGGMHKQYMHNMLHLNQGNLFFSEISQLAGISKTDWSWAALASDLDNDGDRDLVVTNGMRRDLFDGDSQQRLKEYALANRDKFSGPEDFFVKGFEGIINNFKPVKIKNYLFEKTDGYQFKDVTDAWGFSDSTFSHGAALGDLDNDGDLDIVINNLEDQALIFENTATANNYLRINLAGPAQNPQGIGAKITLFHGTQKQYFENKTVRGYLSASESVPHFGLGKVDKVDSIRIQWTDGKSQLLREVAANQVLKVNYLEATEAVVENPVTTLFIETSSEALQRPFTHQENVFNEFEEQILLPHMFSKSGPFLAKGDINGDELEDFFIGGAAGQAGAFYVQRDGKFIPLTSPVLVADKGYEDMGAAFFDADNDRDLDLYVVSGGSQFEEGSPWYQDRLYLNDGDGNFTRSDRLPEMGSSGSCVAPYDVDEDGDLDLFVGGQVVANRYPYPPQSYLLINNGGRFTDETASFNDDLSRIGMVSSATWADVSGDSRAELILVGEWMPLTVLSLNDGKLTDVSKDLGLEYTEGWWNKVIAEDLDMDGDLDLIAGNLGLNYKFSASQKKPFQVFASDFDQNGTNDIFLAKYNAEDLVPIRGKECTSQQMPVISKKFPSYESFAFADLPQIIGPDLENSLNYKVYQFSSMILINEGGRFTLRELPAEAQFSALTSVVIRDFDQDGVKDMLIAGNKFDSEVETTPADASPGYFLKGTGNLNFEVMGPAASGFFVPYNVKDLVVISTGNNTIVLVATNDGPLRTFSIEGRGASL